MPAVSIRHAVTRDLFFRALIMWALVRVMLAMVSTSGYVVVGAPPIHVHPVSMILMCGGLGLIDVRRRGERALWGNLGLSAWTLAAMYAVGAAVGELTWLLVRR